MPYAEADGSFGAVSEPAQVPAPVPSWDSLSGRLRFLLDDDDDCFCFCFVSDFPALSFFGFFRLVFDLLLFPPLLLLLLLFLLLVALAFAVLSTALAVVSGHENCDNGEEIFGKFAGQGSVCGVVLCIFFTVVENHDGALALRAHPFQEVHCESAQAVFVGNHNFFDTALEYGVQNGRKTGAVPVEPAANVGDEFVVWALLFEEGDLALQVWFWVV
jgi:hypothetical protein